jgi:hypothetical protein
MAALLAPLTALAQPTGFSRLAAAITNTINIFVGVLAGIAILIFFWGLALFILRGDDKTEHKKGRRLMLWGLLGIFILFSVWGLVAMLGTIFGIDTITTCEAPSLQLQNFFTPCVLP